MKRRKFLEMVSGALASFPLIGKGKSPRVFQEPIQKNVENCQMTILDFFGARRQDGSSITRLVFAIHGQGKSEVFSEHIEQNSHGEILHHRKTKLGEMLEV